MHYLGFDIGGSSIKAVLIKDKKIIKSRIEKLPSDFKSLLKSIAEIKNKLASEIDSNKIGGIGFAVAGAHDSKRENLLISPNIALFTNNQPLKKIFRKALAPHTVKIENDCNCFLVAEKEIGQAKNLDSAYYLTLGTGVGGALMIDKKLVAGYSGAAGEVGHMIIDLQKNLSLENLASSKFIKKDLGLKDTSGIIDKALAGDKKIQKSLRKLGKHLGVGVANIINILDPQAIIISGGLAKAKKYILPEVKRSMQKFVMSPQAKKTKIIFSRLGRCGGAIGAALLFDSK